MSLGPKFETSIADLAVSGNVIVGVSGGADSVALLHAMVSSPGLGPITVAHVDHQLRDDSARDADWVRDLSDGFGVEFRLARVDVAAEATGTGIGIEEAARNARYRIFRQLAKEIGSGVVAVAHHQDDNTETILHNIIRGTGLSGLSGMPTRRHLGAGVSLVRPLLDVTKPEILGYLTQHGLEYLRDETNDDTAFTRNRIRHDLLPMLERDFNPRVRKALLRLSQQASDVTDFISDQVASLVEHCCELTHTEVRVRCDRLADAPRAVVRQLMRAIWIEQNWPRQKMGYAEWDSLADIVLDQLTGRDLPGGINASRKRQVMRLARNHTTMQ